ncbi:MAG: dTDP-4-dehydrorhamnose 3,5-epimerase family protein [Bradyrhizobium sp.]
MRFSQTALLGVQVIDLDAQEDARGSFARTFCEDEFAGAGLDFRPKQINLSHNPRAMTLRGMHYQAAPHGEPKVVQCIRGRIFDVAVDLRPGSPNHRSWFGLELAPELRRMLFIPEGFAHGFITLSADSDVLYLMGRPFEASVQRGVRWDDPAFAIQWPAQPCVMSPRDETFPDYKP